MRRFFCSGALQTVSKRLVFMGAPGVGKGTFASRLAPVLGIPHVSTGDLVREEISNKTAIGEKIKEYNDKGQLVPTEIVNDLLERRLNQSDAQNGYILDGYPRTIPQAEALEDIAKIDRVVNITLRQDLLVEKICARRICRTCGRNYNVANIHEEGLDLDPLLNDDCENYGKPVSEGGCDLYQRSDDREDVVKDRLKIYNEQTAPLVDHYDRKNILVNVKVTGGPKVMVPKVIDILNKE